MEHTLWQYAGCCRFVWNYFWRMNADRLGAGQRILRYQEMDHWSKWLKQSDKYGFLADAPAHIVQQKLRDLDRAYSDAFDKNQPNKRLPKKRKRHLHSSFRFPSPSQFVIEGRRVKLPKLGWMRFYKSQDIKGEPKNITVSYHAGHWYLSIQVEQVLSVLQPANDSAVGIDVGVAKFATCVSTTSERIYAPLNAYRKREDKLAKAQRKLKHKQQFSNNWKKQHKEIQKHYSKIANARHDYLHKISTEICKNHAMIFIEDLQIANMSKSAKGTIENPGKNVQAKSGLNKSILDQGWHRFRRQLEYKSAWSGGYIVAINPKHTSQKCSCCGYVSKHNRQDQATFHCTHCDFETNADINAARNILAAGLCRDGLCSESHQRSAAETRGAA